LNEAALPGPYPDDLKEILSLAKLEEARTIIEAWDGYAPTPLVRLDGVARALGVRDVAYKDEADRFGLGSFKALGGAYALQRQLNALRPADDQVGARPESILTAVSATDGNHGRSVAWGAQKLGCRSRIYVHKDVSQERIDAIAYYGADIVVVDGNYDDAVSEAAADAAANGWSVISDTSYPGYEDVPKDVMQGYGVMVLEAIAQAEDWSHGKAAPFTHVFVQGGVGGLAASVLSVFWERFGSQRPKVIVVEPRQAACLLESAQAGRIVDVEGELDTIMAGLACGKPSIIAWRVLEAGAFSFVAVSDRAVGYAMAALSLGVDTDQPVVAGESAVAGLLGLLAAFEDQAFANALQLDDESRVLVIGTEGATAPSTYQTMVRQALAEAAGF